MITWVHDSEVPIGSQGLVVGFSGNDVLVTFPMIKGLRTHIRFLPTNLVKTDPMLATCHPRTGACVFKKQPNGKKCSSAPGSNIIDGVCASGVCRRDVLDLCANKSCSNASDCLAESTCDPLTGECISHTRDEGRTCSDRNAATFKDMCIDGYCIGTKYTRTSFQLVGTGFCSDAEGNMLGRYFADTFDQRECESQCATDPACVAYSFGFHFCSIYGGHRDKHPSDSFWKNRWTLGHMWGDTSVISNEVAGVVPPMPGQQEVVCMKKVDYTPPAVEVAPVGHEVAFGILVALLVFTPAIWAILWKCRQPAVDEIFEGGKEDKQVALESLQAFETSPVKLMLTQSHREPLSTSPRNGSASAVAMAPQPLQDVTDGADNEVVPEVHDPRGGSVPVIAPAAE